MEKAALGGHPEVFMRKVKAILADVAYGGEKCPEEALAQIEEKGYALPFEGGDRKVYKIGANYNPATSQIEFLIR